MNRRGAARGLLAVATVLAALAATGAKPLTPRDVLVVLNKTDNTASILDAKTGDSLATIPVGVGPHEAEVLPGGRVVVVSNYGTREKPGRTLSVIDLQNLAPAGTVPLPEGARPHGLKALSANRLLVTAEGLKELLVAEPLKRRLVGRIPIGREVSHMVAAPSSGLTAWVANIGSGSVTAVDPASGKVIAEIPTGPGAEGIDVRPDGAEVWVVNREANTISVIDAARRDVVATIPASDFPIRVKFTPDGRRALVSCARSGDVAVFSVSERREIGRISMDAAPETGADGRPRAGRLQKSSAPVGLLIAPDGRRAWVSCTEADEVAVLDLDALKVVARWKAGREPDGLAGAFVPSR
ncbi:MAG: beta-propeller fold lactonase family protein [Acidobacteriota bacterium]